MLDRSNVKSNTLIQSDAGYDKFVVTDKDGFSVEYPTVMIDDSYWGSRGAGVYTFTYDEETDTWRSGNSVYTLNPSGPPSTHLVEKTTYANSYLCTYIYECDDQTSSVNPNSFLERVLYHTFSPSCGLQVFFLFDAQYGYQVDYRTKIDYYDIPKHGDEIKIYVAETTGGEKKYAANYNRNGKTFILNIHGKNNLYYPLVKENGVIDQIRSFDNIVRQYQNVLGKCHTFGEIDGAFTTLADMPNASDKTINYMGTTYPIASEEVDYSNVIYAKYKALESSDMETEATIGENENQQAQQTVKIAENESLLKSQMASKLSREASGNALHWTFDPDFDVSISRNRIVDGHLDYILRIVEYETASYFYGNVLANRIVAGAQNSPKSVNAGYITGSVIADDTIDVDNCDFTIATPLGYASSHQLTLAGTVQGYTPWFNSIYLDASKKKFVPTQITYKDENDQIQTITVLAEDTST